VITVITKMSSDTIWQEINTRTGVYCYCMQNRILLPVCDSEKENWRILTNKEMYAVFEKPAITEIVKLNRLRWFGHVQRMEENRIHKKVL